MLDNLALYVMLVAAVGLGYLLGRGLRRQHAAQRSAIALREYFQGLNYLLNERPDLAIDTFVESLQVDNDTVDTHLALGSLVRRRGEVDKAIRIHQNLLARPVLSKQNRASAELELARDYLQAGLLDRAETLLKELAEQPDLKPLALAHLLETYQRVRDWERAEEVGRQLMGRGDADIKRALAHFLCERAEISLEQGDLLEARRFVGRARDYDRCFRVELMTAKIDFEAKRHKDVLKSLRRARELRPEFVGETLALYRQATAELDNDKEYRKYLENAVADSPDLAAIEELARLVAHDEGAEAACELLGTQLLRRPTLAGFSRLISEYEQAASSVPSEYMAIVRTFADTLASSSPLYRCGNCGLSGRSLLWQCPSCRLWDRYDPVYDFEDNAGR